MLSESEKKGLRDYYPMHREGGDRVSFDTVSALHRAGVTLLGGTDAPNGGTTGGASLHLELELLVEAGLTPIEAMRAVTASAADAFNLTDRGWAV
jgi:imidazolonepropionase-like amidohydrolase